jgi:hypothetical protein
LRFKPVNVASAEGNAVSLANRLKAGERIAINLPDEVTDGSSVRSVAPR